MKRLKRGTHKKNIIQKILSAISALAIMISYNSAGETTSNESVDQILPEKTTLSVEMLSDSLSFVEEEIALHIEKHLKNIFSIQIESVIDLYAPYFNINADIAKSIARKYTNDYTSDVYLKTFNIGPTILYQQSHNYPTYQAGLIAYLNYLSVNPSAFNITSEELKTTSYQPTPHTNEQFMGLIAEYFEYDPYFAPAISCHETGFYTNNASVEKNNFGGWKVNGISYEFPTPEAGMIYHVLYANKKLINKGIEAQTYIQTFSGEYVYGPNAYQVGESRVDFIWSSGVGFMYDLFKNNSHIFDISGHVDYQHVYNASTGEIETYFQVDEPDQKLLVRNNSEEVKFSYTYSSLEEKNSYVLY